MAAVARERGENLEQVARNERRRFFLEFLQSGGADRIALGHTRSDQAETVLFRFLRGSGTAGLAGIRPVTQDGFVRPLLGMTAPPWSNFFTSGNRVARGLVQRLPGFRTQPDSP